MLKDKKDFDIAEETNNVQKSKHQLKYTNSAI